MQKNHWKNVNRKYYLSIFALFFSLVCFVLSPSHTSPRGGGVIVDNWCFKFNILVYGRQLQKWKNKIDRLLIIVVFRSVENKIAFVRKRHHFQWKASKSRPFLGACYVTRTRFLRSHQEDCPDSIGLCDNPLSHGVFRTGTYGRLKLKAINGWAQSSKSILNAIFEIKPSPILSILYRL